MSAISYQLYGSRNWDLNDTLSMLADVGYSVVEGYGALYDDLDALKRGLDDAGLAMTTGHFGLGDLEADPEGAISMAKQLGMQAVFAPWIAPEERPTDKSGWIAFGKRLVDAGKPVQDAGLVFGWHNHDFELIDLGGGETPLDLIAQASADLLLELDIGWVTRAGLDPVATIHKFGRQISAAHIKDVAPQGGCLDEDGWADVGQGTTEWGAIHAALQAAGVARYVLEHDNPNDHRRFASRSLNAVTKF